MQLEFHKERVFYNLKKEINHAIKKIYKATVWIFNNHKKINLLLKIKDKQ